MKYFSRTHTSPQTPKLYRVLNKKIITIFENLIKWLRTTVRSIRFSICHFRSRFFALTILIWRHRCLHTFLFYTWLDVFTILQTGACQGGRSTPFRCWRGGPIHAQVTRCRQTGWRWRRCVHPVGGRALFAGYRCRYARSPGINRW